MAGMPSEGGHLHALHANPRGAPLYCVPFKAPKALIDALVAQHQGKQVAGTIRWEAPAGSNPCTLTVGSSTWSAQCLEEAQPCDVLLAPQGFPAPFNGALCELGRVPCKLQVERTLDGDTAQRFKSRQEEEEHRGRQRQTKVLNAAGGRRAVTPPPGRRRTPTPPPGGRRTATPPPAARRTPTPPPSSRRATTPSMGVHRGTTPPPPGAALFLGGDAVPRATTPPPAFVRATTPPPAFVRATTPPPLANTSTGTKPTSTAPTRAATPPRGKPTPNAPFVTSAAMHAAAKAGNVRKLVALVLHDRPLPIKGVRTFVQRVAEEASCKIPSQEQLRAALTDIAELRNPGRYYLKPDVDRGLREEANNSSKTSKTPPPPKKKRITPDLPPVTRNGRTVPDLTVTSFTSGGQGAGKHAAMAAALRAQAAREDSTEPISSDSDGPSPAAKRSKRATPLQALSDDSDSNLPGGQQHRPRGLSEPPASLQGPNSSATPPPPISRGSPPTPVVPLPPVVLELARTFDGPLSAAVKAAAEDVGAEGPPGTITTHVQFDALCKAYAAAHYPCMELQQRLVKLRSALRSLQDAADAADDDASRTALLQEYMRVWEARSARAEAWDVAVKRLHARLEAMRSVLDAYVHLQQQQQQP